jgi:multiple sugar transport system permease protein
MSSAINSVRSPLEPSSFSRKSAATLIIIYAFIALVPIAWMVMTSFKSANDAVSYPPKVVFEPSMEGWVNLFTQRSRQSKEYLKSLPPPETWYEELVRSRQMVIAGPSRFLGRFLNSLVPLFYLYFLVHWRATLFRVSKFLSRKICYFLFYRQGCFHRLLSLYQFFLCIGN